MKPQPAATQALARAAPTRASSARSGPKVFGAVIVGVWGVGATHAEVVRKLDGVDLRAVLAATAAGMPRRPRRTELRTHPPILLICAAGPTST